MIRLASAFVVISVIFQQFISTDEAPSTTLSIPPGLKCVVSGTAQAKSDVSIDHHGGKIYFCCEKCRAIYEKDPSKFEVPANRQLVITKQAVQKNCPLTGKPCDGNTKVSVDGVEVAVCCEKCKAKVLELPAEGRAKLIFSNHAMETAFRVEPTQLSRSSDGSDHEEKLSFAHAESSGASTDVPAANENVQHAPEPSQMPTRGIRGRLPIRFRRR